MYVLIVLCDATASGDYTLKDQEGIFTWGGTLWKEAAFR